MTIVFGTGLGPESEPAAEVAALVAARLGVPLRLVHVCEDARAPLLIGTDQEGVLGAFRDELGQQADRLRASTGADVHPHLAAGSVVGALGSLAEIELAKMLIVGGSGRRRRRVAERLSRASPVPMLVLREPERLSAWLRAEKTLRVLVGSDLGRSAEAARAFATRLSDVGAVELEVAMVASPEDTHARLGLAPPSEAGSLSPEAEASLRRELTRTAPPDESGATLRVLPARGRADAHLVARAEEGSFDLVVVGQRRHSVVEELWYGSVTRGVVQSAAVTVASIPLSRADADVSFRPPRVVVVGTELTDSDRRALAHALGYAEEGASVHLVHVLDPTATGDVRQARQDAWYHLTRLAPGDATDHEVTVQPHLLEGAAAEQLRAFSRRLGADLVVLGTRSRPSLGRTLLGSVSRSLAEESEVPLLLVPVRRP